jgi:hypothetical protein
MFYNFRQPDEYEATNHVELLPEFVLNSSFMTFDSARRLPRGSQAKSPTTSELDMLPFRPNVMAANSPQV